jgi:hypothetical protein
VRAGDNLGWSARDGPFVYRLGDHCHVYPLPVNDGALGFTYPVAAYDHDPPPGWPCTQDSGHAVSGGFVYRGRRVPQLQGKYLSSDIVDGRLFYAEEREMRRGRRPAPLHLLTIADSGGRRLTMHDLAGDTRVDLHLGSDSRGELYLLSKANGTIWRITGTRRLPHP